MNEIFYSDKTAIRDFMAIDRTSLANERTFLAYMRTAFTMVIAGVTMMKLLNSQLFQFLGMLVLISAAFLLAFAVYKYFLRRKYFRKTKSKSNDIKYT